MSSTEEPPQLSTAATEQQMSMDMAARCLEEAETAARQGILGEAWLAYCDHASYTQAAASRQRAANSEAFALGQPQPFPQLPPKAAPFSRWLDQLQEKMAVHAAEQAQEIIARTAARQAAS